MAKHSVIKQWINGNEISISVDDNLCDKFRAEVYVFPNETSEGGICIGGSRCATHMAELIEKAKLYAKENEGNVKFFDNNIVV